MPIKIEDFENELKEIPFSDGYTKKMVEAIQECEIERGTGTNWSYMKFPSGELIAWGESNTQTLTFKAHGSLWISEDAVTMPNFSFPFNVKEIRAMTFDLAYNSGSTVVSVVRNGASQASLINGGAFRVLAASGGTQQFRFYSTIYGKWK